MQLLPAPQFHVFPCLCLVNTLRNRNNLFTVSFRTGVQWTRHSSFTVRTIGHAHSVHSKLIYQFQGVFSHICCEKSPFQFYQKPDFICLLAPYTFLTKMAINCFALLFSEIYVQLLVRRYNLIWKNRLSQNCYRKAADLREERLKMLRRGLQKN